MNINGWKYYNRAAIPTCAPHEIPDLTPIKDGAIWKMGGGTPLLARWTSDWDCGYDTNWWYLIKDTPFDISSIKSKRRYEINKGLKLFEVKKLKKNSEYADQMFEVAVDAYRDYPEAYRPSIDRSAFITGIKEYEVYGAFSKDDGYLKAWAALKPYTGYSDFSMMKSFRSYEKMGVNAALIYGILEDYNLRLADGFYICDGARNISHETNFQEYLEKYFEFRKAYCKLHVYYNPKISIFVKCLYPFRKIISRLSDNKFFHKISAILLMEEVARQEK